MNSELYFALFAMMMIQKLSQCILCGDGEASQEKLKKKTSENYKKLKQISP